MLLAYKEMILDMFPPELIFFASVFCLGVYTVMPGYAVVAVLGLGTLAVIYGSLYALNWLMFNSFYSMD